MTSAPYFVPSGAFHLVRQRVAQRRAALPNLSVLG